MKYNRQNRTENPLEVGGGGGDEAAWGELGGGGGDFTRVSAAAGGGFRAASVARVPHPELVPGGPRVSGEARSQVGGGRHGPQACNRTFPTGFGAETSYTHPL